MKKLKLDLDAVRVEQFEILAPESSNGSVLGFASLAGDTCYPQPSCNTSVDQRCRCQ